MLSGLVIAFLPRSKQCLLIRMAINKKITNNKYCKWCGEKGTLLHSWWEFKLIRPLWRIVWRFNKLGINLPYDPPISLLSINPEKTTIQKDTCTLTSAAALFTIARTWKQPRCPSTEKRVKKLYVCIYVYTYMHTQWNTTRPQKEMNLSQL